MSPITLFVGAIGLGLIMISFAVGGLTLIVLPVVAVAFAATALVDVNRRRKRARDMREHRDQARTQSVEFTESDQRTLAGE
jgi:hypothetical protein